MLARLHAFIRNIARKERSGFVKGETITEAINSASQSLWRAKIKYFRKGGDDILLQPFRRSANLSPPYTLPLGATYEIIAAKATTQGTPEIIIAKNEREFVQARISDDYEHIYSSDFTASINAASSGKFDLPNDFYSHSDVFYHEFNGNRYEGQILHEREFLDRRNSYIVPSSEQSPIARIVDDQIEFHPRPTGATTYTFTVPYRKFNPIATYSVSGLDLSLTFDPSTFDEDITLYYFKSPALADATYSLSNGVETVTVVQDLDWNDLAFPELSLRTLAYMGLPTNNQLLMQTESIMEQNDQIDANE